MLEGLLHELCSVLFDIMMRPNGIFELVVDNLTGALGASSAHKGHDSRTAIRIGALKYKMLIKDTTHRHYGKYVSVSRIRN